MLVMAERMKLEDVPKTAVKLSHGTGSTIEKETEIEITNRTIGILSKDLL